MTIYAIYATCHDGAIIPVRYFRSLRSACDFLTPTQKEASQRLGIVKQDIWEITVHD